MLLRRGIISSGNLGGAELWTPIELGSALDTWHDAADRTTQTPTSGAGVSISQWRDKSGKDNHLNQASGSDQPISGSLTLSGMNLIDFSIFKKMVYTSRWTDGGINMFQLLKTDSTDVSQSIYVNSSVSNLYPMIRTNTSTSYVQRGNAAVPNASLETYISGLITPIADQTALRAALSDDTHVLSSISGFDSVTAIMQISHGTGNWNVNGTMAESVIVIGTMTQSDIDKMHGYLSWKWDGGSAGTLVSRLPIGSPYKTFPPTV